MFVLVFWGRAHSTGIETNVTEKGSSTRTKMVGLGVNKLGRVGAVPLPAGVSVFILKSGGGRWQLPAVFFFPREVSP